MSIERSTMSEWPADRVERRPLSSLIPSARNARTHSDAQISEIAASIKEWGWTTPVLVDEAGTIIAGHGRVLGAAWLGIGEAPVMVARGWSDEQIKAYRIADNKIALNAGWDESLLRLELADLSAFGFDLNLLGFSESELAMLSPAREGKTDPDAVPEPLGTVVSRDGDVWLLGATVTCPKCGKTTPAGLAKR